MYRRDLITSEIESLALVLARIMGLKVELKLVEAETLLQQTLKDSFSLPPQIVTDSEIATFEDWLSTNTLSAAKLDSLSEFLYYELGVNESKNKIISPKLNLVYDYLSTNHKVVHLVNLHRQKIIQQYL